MKLNKLVVSFLTFVLPLFFVSTVDAGCFDNMGECCDALQCGCFKITPRVGFSPAIYAKRCHRSVSYATADTVQENDSLTISVHKLDFPNFHDTWEYPWLVGFDFAYDLSNCAQAFVDVNYSQARGKDLRYTISDSITDDGETTYAITDEFHENFDDLKEWNAALGCRYFTGRRCNTSLFLGTKVGLRYRNDVKYDLKIRETTDGVTGDLVCLGKHGYFNNQIVISAGVQIGLDYQINECCAVQLLGEVVGSGTYCTKERNDYRILDDNETPAESSDDTRTRRKVTGGNTTTVVNFPITLGTRLSF